MEDNRFVNSIPKNIQIKNMNRAEKERYGNILLIKELKADLRHERKRRRKLAKRVELLQGQIEIMKILIDKVLEHKMVITDSD